MEDRLAVSEESFPPPPVPAPSLLGPVADSVKFCSLLFEDALEHSVNELIYHTQRLTTILVTDKYSSRIE